MVALQIHLFGSLYLALDIGNSSSKLGIFNDDELTEVERFEDSTTLVEKLRACNAPLIVCNVGEKGMLEAFEEFDPLILDHQTPLPIVNSYETPETLGMDRLAVAVGAHMLYPGNDCLVIDAGTAINYEFISSYGEYKGGAISPGIGMRYRSLNNYTVQLPLLKDSSTADLVGVSTKSSIESGVLNGVLSEVSGMIARYNSVSKGIKVIMCGGDAGFFETRLKESIFVVPNLVLIGLNGILKYNEDRS